MQKLVQLTSEKSTSPYTRPEKLQLTFHKAVVPKFELEPEHEKLQAELLNDLIWPGQLKRLKVVVKETAGWIDILPDVDWSFIDLEERSESERTLSNIERFERDREAFLRIKNDLLERGMYVGQFVAIHEGQIIDHNRDMVELANRVYSQYGYVPIYIDKVEI